MGNYYSHLSWRERLSLEVRLKDGWKPSQIAEVMGRHKSTIYREIKRGKGIQRTTDLIDKECYIPDIAQEEYEYNLREKGPDLKIGKDHEYANYLGSVLRNGYRSPDAALGEIRVKQMQFKTTISAKTLYRYIDIGIIPGVTNADLPLKSRRKASKRKQRKKAARTAKGKSIEERPEIINNREEIGHWEMDTVESNKNGGLQRVLALTGRITTKQINIKIRTGEAKYVVEVLDRLERKLGRKFSQVFRSITVDNGSEFSDCAGMERSCLYPGERRTMIYYCHPYSSWERGTNEKQNGMTRRMHPKGTDFAKVSAKALKATTDWVNHYPRKKFDYHTAEERFREAYPEIHL